MTKQDVQGPIRTFDGRPSKRMLPADSLTVYPEVQRMPPSRSSVKQIADHLDYSKLGVVTVSERPDGTMSLIDGQRRVAALKLRGNGSFKVECAVYSGMTVAQEAEMFLGLNNVRVPRSDDRFFVGVTAKRPDCVGIVDVCAKLGWRVSRASTNNSISCTDAMVKVWAMDTSGVLLHRTIDLLGKVFGRDKNTMGGHLVLGISKFLQRNPDVELALLETKLQAKFASAVSLVANARQHREIEGRGSLAACMEAVIAKVYGGRKKRS